MTFATALRAGGTTLAARVCLALAQDSELLCAKIDKAKPPVYKKPSASSKALDKLKEGTLVHIGETIPARGKALWYEFHELDEGAGFIYAYLAYNLPGTNPFVRAQDVTVLPYKVCFPNRSAYVPGQ